MSVIHPCRIRVLARSEMSAASNPARENEVLRTQVLASNPGFDTFTSCLRDLELHGPLRRALRNHGVARNPITVTDVHDPQSYQVTSP